MADKAVIDLRIDTDSAPVASAFAWPGDSLNLRVLGARAEEPGRAGDLRLEYGYTPFSRPAFLRFSGRHFSSLLCVFSYHRGVKYVAA
jgi:hypothetical protein